MRNRNIQKSINYALSVMKHSLIIQQAAVLKLHVDLKRIQTVFIDSPIITHAGKSQWKHYSPAIKLTGNQLRQQEWHFWHCKTLFTPTQHHTQLLPPTPLFLMTMADNHTHAHTFLRAHTVIHTLLAFAGKTVFHFKVTEVTVTWLSHRETLYSVFLANN